MVHSRLHIALLVAGLLSAVGLILAANAVSKGQAKVVPPPDPQLIRDQLQWGIDAAGRIHGFQRLHNRWPSGFAEVGLTTLEPYDPYIDSIRLDQEGRSIRIELAGSPAVAGRLVEIGFARRNGFWLLECRADRKIPDQWLPQRCRSAAGQGGLPPGTGSGYAQS